MSMFCAPRESQKGNWLCYKAVPCALQRAMYIVAEHSLDIVVGQKAYEWLHRHEQERIVTFLSKEERLIWIIILIFL